MMRKFFVALLAGAVAVGLAAPVYAADLKFTGAYRVRFQFDEGLECMGAPPTAPAVDCDGNQFQTRFKPTFTVETEGGVRGVLGFEIGDIRFGNNTTSPAAPAVGAGGGGGAGADGINVETAWAYIDFPVPATPLRLRAGIQPFFLSKGIILDDDASGLSLYGKLGEINANAWWFRGNSTAGATSGVALSTATGVEGEEARDLYGLDLTMSPMKDLKLNAYLVYEHDQTLTTGGATGEALTGYWVGVGAAGKAANLRWDLDFIYGTKEQSNVPAVDWKGWAVDGGVGMALPGTPLDLEVRGWYATGAEDGTGDEDRFPVISGVGHAGTGAQVWADAGPVDINSLADNMQNTWAIGLIARWTASPTLRVTGNVHYIGTVEEGTTTFGSPVGDGNISGVDSVGTEVGVRIDYTIARGLVFTLSGGHIFLGDDTGRASVTPFGVIQFDDVTKVAGVLNYGF